MRLALYLFALLGVSRVAAQASSVSDLSADEIAKLQDELTSWKASRVGQEAVKMGILPKAPAAAMAPALATASPPTDQLQRLLAAKNTIQMLQKKQPKAKFSLQTPFALMTPQEFAKFANNSNVGKHRELMEQQEGMRSSVQLLAPDNEDYSHRHLRQQAEPTEVDWQKAGCVSHVKNQNQCGICWTFAALGALEGGYCAMTKTLPVLSEQDVLSCGPQNGRCISGWSYVAYDWIIRMNGGSVCTEATYPFVTYSDTGPTCSRWDNPNFKCDKPDLGLVSYVSGRYENHVDLEKVVAQRPVSAQVRAGVSYFQYYSGGVLMGDESLCQSSYADHEVTIVGYGVKDGVKTWKIKNSWGEWWGEQGYVHLERGYQGAPYGTCGIENWSYYPVFRAQAPWVDTVRCGNTRNGGVEILGKTIKTVTVAEGYYGQCCDACRREPGCVAAVMASLNTCILKSTVEGERFDPNFAFSSVMVMPKAEANSFMCMPTVDNYDYPGNDISRTLTKTPLECCDKCTLDMNCRAYTWTKWMGGSCFLKYSKATPVWKAPQADGTPYFKSGEVYKCQPLRANTDFVGEDFMNKPAKTAAECCAICLTNWRCQAFSWNNYQGGTCWFKTKAVATIAKTGVWSATVN